MNNQLPIVAVITILIGISALISKWGGYDN